jgi:beta-glucosidase
VLPAQSICLVVPIVTPQQSGRIEAVQQERSAKALAARPSADPAGIEDTSK